MNISQNQGRIEKNIRIAILGILSVTVLGFVLLLIFGVTFPTLNVEEGQITPVDSPLLSIVGLIVSLEIFFAYLFLPSVSNSDISDGEGKKGGIWSLGGVSNSLIALGYIFSFYRGFRMPNLWTMGYYVPSYFDGMRRRVLSGTLLYVFGDLRFNYYFIVGIQLAVFLALNFFLLKSLFKSRFEIRLLFAFFLFSPAGGYLFHEIGYIDQLLLLLLLVVILSRNHYISGALVAISPLFHEEAMFIVLPVYSFHVLFAKDRPRKMWLYPVLLAVVSFLASILLKTSGSAVTAFAMKWMLNANYTPRFDYAATVLAAPTTSFAGLHYAEHQIPSLAISVLVGVFAAFTASVRDSGLRKYFIFTLGIICISLPLCLGFIGWDTSRWIFLSITASLFVFFIARENLKGFVFYASVCCILLFSFQVKLRYFDGYRPRKVSINSVQQFIESGFIQESTRIPKL